MATSVTDGEQTAVIDTEHTLTTQTTDDTYVLLVDTNAMVLGDKLTLRAKVKVRSTGTTRLAYTAEYSHVQGEPVKISIPVPTVQEVVFTLEQTAGTGRAFPWEVVSL
jgi:hypothetical protein